MSYRDRYVPPDNPPSQLSEASKRRRAAAVWRRQGEFLCGPIPLPWLIPAAALPGKALAVGVALWFKAGVSRTHTVPASGSLLRRFGVGSGARARGLRLLENAGLIEVERHVGRCPVVTICDVSKKTLLPKENGP
mgnify:CR=1 FL=1